MTAPREDVLAELDRILASQALNGSDQLKRLLKLVVTRKLDGQADLVKEYNLGLEVFQRPPDYDPKVDPIVRVQARRLRARLDEYFAVEGIRDPLVIQIPKGAYVPVFEKRSSPSAARRPPKHLWIALAAVLGLVSILAGARLVTGIGKVPDNTGRSVAVLPLEAFAPGGDRSYVADEVTEVLITELSKNTDLRVVSRTTASRYRDSRLPLPGIARELGVRWVVEGGVGIEGDHTYLKLRLVDSTTDRKVWADVFDFTSSQLVPVSSRAGDVVGAAILAQLRSQPQR
jgi:TolB-like protein